MKSLGVIATLMLLTVSFPGTSAPALMNPNVVKAFEMNEAITGQHVDVADLVLVASEDFTLPLGAIGVQASYDSVSDVMTVVPISAVPDTSGESGCIIANSFVGFGYGVSGTPPPIGDYQNGCTFAGQFAHPGAPENANLVCVNDGFCQVAGIAQEIVGFFAFNTRVLVLYCQFNTVTVAGASFGQPANSLGNGICQAFSITENAEPPGYYSYVIGQQGTSVTAGLINY